MMMESLGYESFLFGASFSDRWSPEEGRDEAVWTLTMQDGADIELGYTLSGVTADWVIDAIGADTEPEQMMLLGQLALESANIRVTDRSLLERAFEVAAQLQGLNVDGASYREQIRGAIPFMLSTAVPEAIASMISEPLQAYLGGGQTLIVELNPPQPVSLLQVMSNPDRDAAAATEMLGLTLRTEPAPQQQ
jgi:hypothetical protein